MLTAASLWCATCLCSLLPGVYGVAKMLGLYQPPDSYWSTENMTRSATKQLTPGPSSVGQGMIDTAVGTIQACATISELTPLQSLWVVQHGVLKGETSPRGVLEFM